MLENYFTNEKIIVTIEMIEKLDSGNFDLVLIFVPRNQVESILPELTKIKEAESFLFIGDNFLGFDKACQLLGKERVLAGHARSTRSEMKALSRDFLEFVVQSFVRTDMLEVILNYI